MNQESVYTKSFLTNLLMQKYSVHITNQAHESLRDIVSHKIEYIEDIPSAERFADGFYEQAQALSILPHRGFNMPRGNKAQVYRNHLIIYNIQEPIRVTVLDIIDPKQDTVASKYY